MSDLVLIGVIIVLLLWNIASEILHYRERRSLYNRLMASNLGEVKAMEEKPKSRSSTLGNPLRKQLVDDGLYKE